MIPWGKMGRRCALAWAALGGAFDAGPRPSSEQTVDMWSLSKGGSGAKAAAREAKQPSAAAWRKQVGEWSDRRAKGAPGDGTYEEGRALMESLRAMAAPAKEAVGQEEGSAIFSVGDELLDAASRSCDMPDPQWAREQTALHALFCQALGSPVESKALREAAQSTSGSAWWEVANDWGVALGAHARRAAQGADPWGDEEAQSMCDVVALCSSKAILGALDGEGMDPRDVAAWRQCSRWPWPQRELAPGVVEWARRKWRDAVYSTSDGLDVAFAAMPTPATWGGLAMARSGLDHPKAWFSKPGSQEAMAELRAMFNAERERDAMGAATLAGGGDAAAVGALSRAL